MSIIDSGTRLRGRHRECEALDRLITSARAGESAVLVLRGDAGIGKSVLLDYLQEHAAGCRVVRAAGAESEMELAFAGLHQLCAPFLDQLDRLPQPQHDALATAFGLSGGEPPDRFLVGLAVLTLLSEVAADQPLVCIVDDAHWLDRVSTQTLAFVSRRLVAEPVAMAFAVRAGDEQRAELSGLPELVMGGLGILDARALLDSAVAGRLDEGVRDRIVAETRGNPLALLELPRGMTPAALGGGFAAPDVRPLDSQIEQTFAKRVGSLPVDTRRLLLTAAAEPVGDVPLVRRAADLLGIAADAAAPAEAAGLIEFRTRVRFRHPLVRSAVYRAGTARDREQIHRALAEATDPESDPDRRAWHRALASAGPDETVAAELERSAERAQRRGGVAAAASFLERAAELTPDPARRGTRATAAARAKLQAGAPDTAYDLLTTADWGLLDELQRAQRTRLRAQITFVRRRGSDALPLFLDAARRLEPLDHAGAREALLEALDAALFAGRLGRVEDARDAARAARAAPAGPDPPRPIDLLLDGMTTRLTDGYAAGVAPLTRALRAFQQQAGGTGEALMSWLWLACPVVPEPIAPDLWDEATWHELATRAVELARKAGALTVLPVALSYRAGVHVHAGEFAAASRLIAEADAITAAAGNAPMRYTSLLLVASRGREAAAVTAIEAATAEATARGEGRALGLAGYATALLRNGLGHYPAALAAAREACEYEDLGFYGSSLVELVEAATRGGVPAAAATAVEQLDERTRASGTAWALGIQARSQALLADGDHAEDLYRQAIDHLGHSRAVVQLARAHLLYGEWLRRENRRVDARQQLRTAMEMLAGIGAQAFADRARRELAATGETVRKRTDDAGNELTPQEGQIARLARDGMTNPEIAAQLFISPHTVEWHLRKVFAKLGITSRRQLPSRRL
jgi:AAA ATPase-like protein/regulatory LuxR family protein